MMNSTDSERMSVQLSTVLERRFLFSEETLNIKRKATVIRECISSSGEIGVIHTGSYGEGCDQKGSDTDFMFVDKNVVVMYPDQRIPRYLANKTILYIREAVDGGPGYVHLEVGQLTGIVTHKLYDSLVIVNNKTFISSDMYREQCAKSQVPTMGMEFATNGPSTTCSALRNEFDIVNCFPCYIWSREAEEWLTRPRLYGWPDQTLIEKIVKSGCHMVPVGDKCSNDTFLQWRISFAAAEKCLVHSFSYVQVKVYALLKYFLKQIKKTLKETIGDDDILCSYFMKTVMFYAIEDTTEIFWQDKNIFYCFWFCFNILIGWVRAGFCPNYFIPANNMFKRKVHGLHQQMLLCILEHCHQKKWLCLSLGNFFKPSIWEDLCDTNLSRPLSEQERLLHRHHAMFEALIHSPYNFHRRDIKAFDLLSVSKSDFDEVYTYFGAMCNLRCIASELISEDVLNSRDISSNKNRYTNLRKCRYWISPNALMGTDVMHLATFHFMTGNFIKCLEICRQVRKLVSCYNGGFPLSLYSTLQQHYLCHRPGGGSIEILQILCKIYINVIALSHIDVSLSHLCLEMSMKSTFLYIPPLPYVLFLNFLCYHELGNTSGRDEALRNLIQVQHDKYQGGQLYWITNTLLGICYQILGDFHMAIRAYLESAQSKSPYRYFNPAIDRIAIVYLCMYASQLYPNTM
ncbi:uncharacterized protein [Argopecten irradians]|uniref:uncharacterized protein n=1 Tax=Argopecten irradians TaxID=31199 RepID=UPI0037135957